MLQTFISGLGNIYVNEVLFRSKISPFTLCNRISILNCMFLVKNIRLVVKKAILFGGSTLKNFNSYDGSVGTFQNYFYIYDRGNEVCRVCGSLVLKRKYYSRSSFYCMLCQGFF